MNVPSGWELILVLLVIVVVFGSKRLPDSARSLGRSMRILKAETKGLRDDDTPPSGMLPSVTATPLQAGPLPTPDLPVPQGSARVVDPAIEQQRQP